MPEKKDSKIQPLNGEIVKQKIAEQSGLPALAKTVGKSGNIFIGTLNLMSTPAKVLARPLHRHYHRKYHGKYKHAKKIFAFDLVLVGAAAALLTASIYFFFFAKSTRSFLDISLPQAKEATIGQTQDFAFQLKNLTDTPLDNLVLRFEFPKNFLIKETPPGFNSDSQVIFIDSLKEKLTQTILFKGQPWGGLNELQKINVRAQFFDKKNQTAREEIFSLPITLTKTILKTDWTMPDNVLAGQNFNLTFSYRNDSTETIKKAIFLLVLPPDFEILASNPPLQDGRFVLENLLANGQGQIFLTGFLRSSPSAGNLAFSLQTFLENGGQQFLQTSLLKNLKIADNGFVLQARLEGEKKYLKPGEDNVLTVNFQNKSGKTIKDAIFSLSLPSSLIENKIEDVKKTEILPEENGQIIFKFKLKEKLDTALALEKNFSLTLQPMASFYFKDNPTELLRSFAPVQNFKVSGAMEFHVQARYFSDEGDQLGRGPLPPRVGQTTKYWINWFVTAWPNGLKKATLLGQLAPNVTWTGKTNVSEGEPIKYDPTSRTISWQSDLIQATPNGRCPCEGVSFELALTPSNTDIGQTALLLENLSLLGIDESTGEEISKSILPLTTDLTSDTFVKGKGVVQP